MSSNTISKKKEEIIQYSRMFSSLFCSMSIVALSMLCLLNNLTLDLYSAANLILVVGPGATCFWMLGFIIGRILDSRRNGIVKRKKMTEKQAYEIPSMFSGLGGDSDDDLGVL